MHAIECVTAFHQELMVKFHNYECLLIDAKVKFHMERAIKQNYKLGVTQGKSKHIYDRIILNSEISSTERNIYFYNGKQFWQ